MQQTAKESLRIIRKHGKEAQDKLKCQYNKVPRRILQYLLKNPAFSIQIQQDLKLTQDQVSTTTKKLRKHKLIIALKYRQKRGSPFLLYGVNEIEMKKVKKLIEDFNAIPRSFLH